MYDPVASIKEHETQILVSGYVMTAFTTIAVGLRLLSKRTTTGRFGIDDWLMIIIQVLWYGQFGLQIKCVVEGNKATSPGDVHFQNYIKYLYIFAQFLFPMTFLVNLSILTFYRSVFAPEANRTFHYLSIGVMIFNVVWFIPGWIVNAALCTPISTFWEHPDQIPDKCINYSPFWLTMTVSEFVLDAVILALPVREIMKLQLSMQNKWMISLIFLLGGFVIFTNIGRISEAYIPHAQLIDLSKDILWSNIHLGLQIICACLPTYRPLVRKSVSIVSHSMKKYSSTRSSSGARNSVPPSGSNKSGARAPLPDSLDSNSRNKGSYPQFSSDEVNLV